MGQRANYIFKEGETLTIHYNHWRANCIATDLYLGEKAFLEFVKDCQIQEEIINEPWIEACVIIDKGKKELFFWSFDFLNVTSVVEYYLEELSQKWTDWKVHLLTNRMYDVERVLAIDYISKQELVARDKISREEILKDKVDGWVSTSIIIKQDSTLFVHKTANLGITELMGYGKGILPLLKDKPQYALPKEGDEGLYECLLINEDRKKVFINQSSIGLLETCSELWEDYELIMGDFGYIKMLKLAGIDTTGLELSKEEVQKQFAGMIQRDDDFDPIEMAERLKKEFKDVQFNPNFFDNTKPKKD